MTSVQKHFHVCGPQTWPNMRKQDLGATVNSYLNGCTTFKACPHKDAVTSCLEIIHLRREGGIFAGEEN